jgi:hypothetical protein
MVFFKITAADHPTRLLPSVQWNKQKGCALFAFKATGISRLLSFETEDPELIDLLSRAGYLTEPPPGLGRNMPGIAMAGLRPIEGGDQ